MDLNQKLDDKQMQRVAEKLGQVMPKIEFEALDMLANIQENMCRMVARRCGIKHANAKFESAEQKALYYNALQNLALKLMDFGTQDIGNDLDAQSIQHLAAGAAYAISFYFQMMRMSAKEFEKFANDPIAKAGEAVIKKFESMKDDEEETK